MTGKEIDMSETNESQSVSAAKFLGGGGGRIIMAIAAIVGITYLVSIKAFDNDWHFVAVLISFCVISGAVASKEIIKMLELVLQIVRGTKREEPKNESNSGSDQG